MPIIRSGGNEVKASLGQMMNTEVFRKHIDDLLGEDLAQHIDYLACKELGGNLRNKYVLLASSTREKLAEAKEVRDELCNNKKHKIQKRKSKRNI